MLARQIYYELKPFLPRGFRFAMRRFWAQRKRERFKHVWPIDEAAAKVPKQWPGWPDSKAFALVLSHDVEGPEGLANCRQLAELEMSMGFRSSFNFIPEGTYRVPTELRNWLTEHGFEVGVHDLHHDGKLYRDKKKFAAKATQINRYIKDWKAVGFRSGFMLRNLDWIHQLDIVYDSSTFDTDPFEPQCDGYGTIFPFWIPAPDTESPTSLSKRINRPAEKGPAGYFELPYTLPQDSTLFLILKERTPDIWLQKLDWVAAHGGMALVNVHPDYVQFEASVYQKHTFPVEFYTKLLHHASAHHSNKFWHVTPRHIAEYMAAQTQRAIAI